MAGEHTRNVATKWKNHTMPCPEDGCTGTLRLRYSWKYYNYFYGCSKYPACGGGHGAYPSGAPLGVPANAETKEHRKRAHRALDRLWKGDPSYMTRAEAYDWIAECMGREIHMASLDIAGCGDVIRAVDQWFAARSNEGATKGDPKEFEDAQEY